MERHDDKRPGYWCRVLNDNICRQPAAFILNKNEKARRQTIAPTTTGSLSSLCLGHALYGVGYVGIIRAVLIAVI